MLTAMLLAVAVLAVGARLSDAVRLKQEQVILHKLDLPQAHAFYETLKRRATRTKILRALTMASLLVVIFAIRKRFFDPATLTEQAKRQAATATAPRPSTSRARLMAQEELDRYARAQNLNPADFTLENVGSDANHPWTFDFRLQAKEGTPADRRQLVRVYVAADGKMEVHRIFE